MRVEFLHLSQLPRLLLAAIIFPIVSASSAAPPREETQRAIDNTLEAAAPLLLAPLPTSQALRCIRTGLVAAKQNDWAGVRAAQSCAVDRQAKDVLTWRLAVGDRDATFAELDTALTDVPDWPQLDLLRTRARIALAKSGLTSLAKIDWLYRQRDTSADALALLATQLAQAGRQSDGATIARAAFVNETLSAEAENDLWTQFSTRFTPSDIGARVSALQWRGDHTRARRFFRFLDADARLTADAWAAISASNNPAAFAQLTPIAQNRVELLFAETQRLRRAGEDARAAQLALRIHAADAPLNARVAIFQERRRLIVKSLAANDPVSAYALSTESGLDRGETYADAEWLAGWLALRRLNDPVRAQAHFSRLRERVSTPVSLARAAFWLGQAQQGQGRLDEAAISFVQAAHQPPTFFGQLAAAQIAVQPRPLEAPIPTALDRMRFEGLPFVRALRWMGEAGDQWGFEMIALHVANQLTNPLDYSLLADIARSSGFPGSAVRTAKVGIRRGYFALDAAYPIAALPRGTLTRAAEPALVLAVIRQESEWDATVISPAGARGLMQLMPQTARAVCQAIGVPYQLAALTSDATYNMTLGSAYLGQLVEQFGGSYVLAIAAYNAGPDRVREWIAAYGDPRSHDVDTIDWIESIPFAETRNYVQRVLENVQVYRQRLNDHSERTLAEDLDRGARPA
ncbi:MAG: lytic transglycosylase domain-containing protein [Alphaproteobacteria bacterium]